MVRVRDQVFATDVSPREAFLSASALLYVLALAACASHPPSRPVILATTTSVGNSGLLEVLLPTFQQQHDLLVRSHLVGSGLALRMLETGDADIVISHAPAAEAAAVRVHPNWRYHKVMFNDFIIVGPRDDPAHVKGASDASTAMQRIASSSQRFLSRGDQSGTHEREERLWRLAGTRPRPNGLIVAGEGMGATLRIASETGAYTLTDRATFVQHADMLHLVIVFEGGPGLMNAYAVILDPESPRAPDARLLFDWLSDGAGRDVIRGYRLRGVQTFFPWPEGQPREDPHAVPQ